MKAGKYRTFEGFKPQLITHCNKRHPDSFQCSYKESLKKMVEDLISYVNPRSIKCHSSEPSLKINYKTNFAK